MRFFYPKALVRFTALVQLSRLEERTVTVTDVVVPRTVSIERNDYNTADKIDLEIDAQNFPVLPRLIRQVLVQVYAGDAGSISTNPEDLQDDDSLIRFVGYVDDPEMSLDEGDSRIKWEARDFTALLLDTKRPSRDAVPKYGDRLDVALRRILDHVPGGENIGLELQGLDEWPELSVAAPKGLKDAALPVKPDDSLWHLVKRACDPVALIPRIVLDKLVVGTSRGLRAPSRRPVFMVGDGITKYSEKRHGARLREGIGLRAYDISQRKMITAVYPPPGDWQIRKSLKVAVKKKATPPPVPGSDDKRQWFPYPSVASQDALEDAAERLYEERGRQEFEGKFEWVRMAAPTDDDDSGDYDYDVTGLENGDRIFVAIDAEHRRMLGGVEGFEARVQLLIDLGYSEQVAGVLVQAYEENADGALEVYVRKAVHKYLTDGGYELEVDFQALLTTSKQSA
jgi:hypothetical protein